MGGGVEEQGGLKGLAVSMLKFFMIKGIERGARWESIPEKENVGFEIIFWCTNFYH
jgi:hypothetical protein